MSRAPTQPKYWDLSLEGRIPTFQIMPIYGQCPKSRNYEQCPNISVYGWSEQINESKVCVLKWSNGPNMYKIRGMSRKCSLQLCIQKLSNVRAILFRQHCLSDSTECLAGIGRQSLRISSGTNVLDYNWLTRTTDFVLIDTATCN